MANRYLYRGNILSAGMALFLLFGAVIFVIGHVINGIAQKMNNSLVMELCQAQRNSLLFEIDKTQSMIDIIDQFVGSQESVTEEKLSIMVETVLKLDPKISRAWLMNLSTNNTFNSTRNSDYPTHNSTTASTSQRQIASLTTLKTSFSQIYRDDNTSYLNISQRIFDKSGQEYTCGLDLSLPNMYHYLSQLESQAKSYAFITNRFGLIVTHPDSLMIGGQNFSTQELHNINQVANSKQSLQTTVVSEYLGVLTERIYYPLNLGNETMVMAVSVPQLSINDHISNFHRYTLIASILSVLLFFTLLILSQARLNREYELRRKAEKESAMIQLQQVLDQINPHFLFNSLNSLYALIKTNTTLAREFILKLSGVYRYALEHGQDMLSSVDNEIEFTMKYYFLQKIRFDNQIELNVEIDPNLLEHKIPSMSLQSLVENAIKHNCITPQNPLLIHIYTADQKLVIENNYTQRENSDNESFGVGLERIRSIYKFYINDGIVVIHSEKTFRCELPLLPPTK